MTKSSVFILRSVVMAAITVSASAMAHPGGGPGGGMGGGMGGIGGMGIGHDMSVSRGADLPDRADSRASIRSNIDTPMRPTVSTHSSTTLLDRNARLDTALSTSLTRRGVTLPSGGLRAACAGYNTLGNCVAALHVANNLGLRGGFTALKGLTTGSGAVSLGDAIKELRPDSDAKAAVRMANHQARADIEASGG